VSEVELRVVDDPGRAAAEEIARVAAARGSIALSGGSTPRDAYQLAAKLEGRWRDVDLWFVDERCVPPSDARSNYHLVRENLIDGLAVPPNVHRIRGERAPQEAADDYDAELRDASVELALLGIGADGHTASLFPGSAALDESERLAVVAEPGLEPLVPRVTMTIPALAQVGLALYLVTGAEKAEAVERAFRGEPSRETPASLVRGRRTVAVLDSAAAARVV
jgi:6-phosphogluconolactonase